MYMFETIMRIYNNTGNAEAVMKAKTKGWITEEEAEQILGATTAPENSPE